MPALETIGQYITESRVLLQDQFTPFRYTDEDIVTGLNIGLMEARRIRADLFLPVFDVPYFDPSGFDEAAPVPFDMMYRSALLYYIVGRMQLRDDEATTDARAVGIMGKFQGQLLGVVV